MTDRSLLVCPMHYSEHIRLILPRSGCQSSWGYWNYPPPILLYHPQLTILERWRVMSGRNRVRLRIIWLIRNYGRTGIAREWLDSQGLKVTTISMLVSFGVSRRTEVKPTELWIKSKNSQSDPFCIFPFVFFSSCWFFVPSFIFNPSIKAMDLCKRKQVGSTYWLPT